MAAFTFQVQNSDELNIQLPRINKAFRSSARATKSFRGAFRTMGRDIDRVIKDNFVGPDWAPLSLSTIDARFKERGYYGDVIPRQDKIGRWSDDMYEGLLGRGVLGETSVEDTEYHRTYRDHGPRSQRVVWFHEGTKKKQPARPFWRKGERTGIAKRVMREYTTARISNRFL